MKAVVNLSGKIFSLSNAVKADSKGTGIWRCALCRERVGLRKAFGRPSLIHPDNGCTLELENFDCIEISKRASAILNQNWALSVSLENNFNEPARALIIPLERVAPLILPEFAVPMVLVQSYWTVFLVGIVTSAEQEKALTAAANALSCGALSVPVTGTSWAELTEKLLSKDSLTVWVTEVEQERVKNKRGKFNLLARRSTAGVGVQENRHAVHENRRAEHYDPKEPTTDCQYLQDITGELRAQRWAKWVRRLVLGRDWGRNRREWFDVYPIQVPHFWLRFWLIKHSLYMRGRVVDTPGLARELASIWGAENDRELVDAIEEVFLELLPQLEKKGMVETKGSQFSCVRSFR